MKLKKTITMFAAAAFISTMLLPITAAAQREVHWQINPKGFPGNVSVFVDVEDRGSFRRDLTSAAFAISVDEYAGDQGGYIMNAKTMRAGWAGAQVLIMIDSSRSYAGEFSKAKRMAKSIVNYMDVNRDQVAVASFPSTDNYSESSLVLPFSSSKEAVNTAIDKISMPPKKDKSGARICNALTEGLHYFPNSASDKYRVVIYLTGGADKGEGKGDCVKESFAAGKVPFYSMLFKLDRRYDDPRNAHKIENGSHDLAQKTGGRSIFRCSESEYNQFAGLFWNRIRSQYLIQVTFPCYRPAPYMEHTSILKVENQDWDPIKFRAPSAQTPVPQITAIYPPSATRKQVDDGLELTIDGSGFCGASASQIKAYVNGRPISLSKMSPYRIVGKTNSNIEAGTVKIINRFGQSGESSAKFEIVKPPKGAEASGMMTILVIIVVFIVVLAILIVALRSRKAKVPAGAPPTPSKVSGPAPVPSGNANKTVAMNAVSNAWVIRADDSRVDLESGANLIGREPHCKIQITTPGVSREHAKLDVDFAQGMIWVEDLGSTNGTLWGPKDATDQQLTKLEQRKLLTPGETVWVGGEKLTVFFNAGAKEG